MKTLLILLAMALPCSARVGERYEDFLKRPGLSAGTTETRGNFTVANHKRDGISIRVFVVGGVISLEIYSPLDANQTLKIMENTGGVWQRVESTEPKILRWRSDKGVTAYCDGKTLVVGDGRAEKLLAEMIRAEQRGHTGSEKKIEGL